MARPSAAARNLSLTEELEKLEQSITLTLQGESAQPILGICGPDKENRNRPQFQQGASDRHHQHPTSC